MVNLGRNCHNLSGGDTRGTSSGLKIELPFQHKGAVGELVGIDGGVVSGLINLELSGVEASDWRPRHDERYHEA